MPASSLARRGDLVFAASLFVLLAALSWLRWASFQGDLSRVLGFYQWSRENEDKQP